MNSFDLKATFTGMKAVMFACVAQPCSVQRLMPMPCIGVVGSINDFFLLLLKMVRSGEKLSPKPKDQCNSCPIQLLNSRDQIFPFL